MEDVRVGCRNPLAVEEASVNVLKWKLMELRIVDVIVTRIIDCKIIYNLHEFWRVHASESVEIENSKLRCIR